MNLNHSIFVPVGYGLISLCKHTETITHHKNSFRSTEFHNNKFKLGYTSSSFGSSVGGRRVRIFSANSSYQLDNSASESDENCEKALDLQSKEDFNNELTENIGNDPKNDINEDLSNLISAHTEVIKKGLINEDLSKYDWFDDEPVDSSDEELMTEYYETKLPDYNSIYRHLDPVGLKNYVPDTSNSEFLLGSVYEVGESLIDDKSHHNTHTYQEIVEKSNKNRYEHIMNKIVCNENTTRDEFREQVDLLNREFDESVKKKLESAPKQDQAEGERDKKLSEEDELMENYEGVDEFDFGKEFVSDSEDAAIEDEMCRFFLEIPLRFWVRDEVKAYETSMKKLEKSQKYYSPMEEDSFVTDIRRIFKDSPMTTLGIFDNELIFGNDSQRISSDDEHTNSGKCIDNGQVDNDHLKTSKEKIKELYVKEYKHSDLLNDIDKYESSEYPPIVELISKRDLNKPIFVLGPEKNNLHKKNEHLIGEDISEHMLKGKLRVYVGVPKNFIKFEEFDSVTINDFVAFRRSYDICVGKVIERIPLQDEYYSAIVVLPNQSGYRDQNIRYLADELAINTKGLVFVPDIPVIEGEDWYFSSLNRLLKLIQAVYKVDRVSLVGLGEQGNLLLNYVEKSMKKTISQYQSAYSTSLNLTNSQKTNNSLTDRSVTDDSVTNNSLTENSVINNKNELNKFGMKNKDELTEFLKNFSTKRAEDLIRRQSIPMLDELLDGLKGIKLSQSHKMAMKEKDVNIIKPVSRLLQSIVLFDTCNIEFEKLINLSVPTMVIQSNRTNLIDRVISSESESFAKLKNKKVYDPMFKGIDMFSHAIADIPNRLKTLINRQTGFKFIPSDRNVKIEAEQYYITSFHRGIDIMLYVFKKASPHFYMKKPNSPKSEHNVSVYYDLFIVMYDRQQSKY